MSAADLERCPFCGIRAETVCDTLPPSYCEQALNATYTPDSRTRTQRVMESFACSYESAAAYLDLRDEGYDRFAAALMAGLSDPTGD